MSDPIEQHTLNGYSIGEIVGYVSRGSGYRCEIIEVVSHDHIQGRSSVKLRLPNSASVIVWDDILHEIAHADTSSH